MTGSGASTAGTTGGNIMGGDILNDVTSWLFAIGLMVGAVSLLVFIGVGLAPLFRKDAASPQARQQRHH
ncbi:hypothetical protein [Arthrobacter sp. RAF14]|uniref:hypothetical protein n=1 Tax=Arthrobacter sp. RAF14 TaxID=3233051 RepID=UPI003F8E4933